MESDRAAITAISIGRRQFIGVGAASLAASIVGYIVIVVTTRTLTPADNAIFLTFWSVLFAWFGILGGLSSEMTRATNASDSRMHPVNAPRMLAVGLAIGTGLSALLAATGFLWGPLVLGAGYGWLLIPLSAAVVLYSGHASVVGILGGRAHWGAYARLVTVDSVVRLVLVVTTASVAATTFGFAVAACISPLTWLVGLVFSRKLKRAVTTRADTSLPQFSRRLGHAMAASGSAAILVVGFPVLLRLTSTDAIYLASAPLILAISLTRAPLLIPLNAYQGVAIAHFVNNRAAGLRTIWPVTRIVLGVGALGAALAWFIGPWIMSVIFGGNYRVEGWVLALLTFDAASLAILTLTGSLCLALTLHSAFSGGWLTGTAVTIVVLLLPLPIELRSVIGLFVGPALGIGIHLLALRRAAPLQNGPAGA